ncbi:MAG: hypothetical protein PHO37_05285 [Kiritimatiellae bacterium]|nr:hypothetical protein [Kiritimatiellia bacterium]
MTRLKGWARAVIGLANAWPWAFNHVFEATEWSQKVGMAKNNRVLWLSGAVFCVFMVLYALTAQRGVSWQDSGEFQYRLLVGDYAWNSGIARAHPLYILIGRCFIAVFPAALKLYACSLLSGLFMAIALALLFYLVVKVTDSIASGMTSVVLLGLAHMAWWMSTVAEVYTLSLLFVMAELICLYYFLQGEKVRPAVALFALNGAHFAVHNVALLVLPVYGVVLIAYLFKDFRKRALICAGVAAAWLAGGSLIWWLAMRMFLESAGISEVFLSILFGDGYQKHVLGVVGFKSRLFLANMALAGLSFLNPAWFFVLGGFFCNGFAGCKSFKWALAAVTGVHFVFWVRYFVPDQATFILPLLGLLAVWAGVGSAALKSRFSTSSGLIVLVGLGAVVNLTALYLLPVMAEKKMGDFQRARSLPGRGELSYWMQPWKCNERSAAEFVENVRQQLGEDDILYADSTAAAALMADRAQGKSEETFELLSPWTLLDRPALETAVEKGQLYVVSAVRGYLPEWLLGGDYEFEKKGVLYRVSKAE